MCSRGFLSWTPFIILNPIIHMFHGDASQRDLIWVFKFGGGLNNQRIWTPIHRFIQKTNRTRTFIEGNGYNSLGLFGAHSGLNKKTIWNPFRTDADSLRQLIGPEN
jgi:hypothetical protein